VARGLFSRRPGERAAFHRQHRHLVGKTQQWEREGIGAGLLRAAIPSDQDVASKAARRGRRGYQDRAAAVEQCRFQRRHSGILRIGPRPPEHDQIEITTVVSDEGILRRLRPRPAVRIGGRLLVGLRHPLARHESFELGARLIGGIAFESARDRQAADRLDGYIGPRRRANREAFHVAVELAGNQPGGLQDRRHGIVIFGRYQQRFHAGPCENIASPGGGRRRGRRV
jgi:hypothetical protein